MDEEELFDQSFWVSIVQKLPELQEDPVGAEFVVDQFVGQYFRPCSEPGVNKTWTTYGWLFGTTWSQLVPAASRSV